jgi:hypothetical protein
MVLHVPDHSDQELPHRPDDFSTGCLDGDNVPVERKSREKPDDPCSLVSDGLENGQLFRRIASIHGESRDHFLNGRGRA